MSSPLRVALLAGPLIPREPAVLAGNLIREFPPHEIVPVLAAGEGVLSSRLAAAGADILNTPLTGRVLTEFGPLRRLRRDLEDREVSLIHVLDQRLTRHGSYLSAALELPLVVSTDGALPALPRPPDALLVPSRSAHDELSTRRRAAGIRTVVVPPGIRTNGSRSAPPPFGGGLPVIGTVTLRDDPRGIAGVLRAGKHLLDAGRDLHILIAGTEKAERLLRKKARDLGVARHVTVAALPAAYMRIFESLDLFVRPGRRGGFGVSLLSAMAAGRPVVAAGVGTAFAFVREGVTGFLAPRRNSAALAERIAWLLDHRDRAVTMGRAGRELVRERFAAPAFAATHAEVYRSLTRQSEA